MKNLKKELFIAVFMLSIFITKAQEQTKKEKMEALKIAYIAEKLDLSEAESQKFWPIFNDYQKDKKAIHGNKKGKEKPNLDEMSDQEIENLINEKVKQQQSTLDLRIEYITKFKTVLPIIKVAKLLEAQKGFRKEILKRMKNNK